MLLDSLWSSLFRPGEGPLEIEGAVGVGIFAILALSLALPDAGRLQTGLFGAVGLAVVLFGLCLAGWFWTSSAIALLAKLAGGRGTVQATLGAIAQACWPLILVAPGVAAGNAGLIEIRSLTSIAVYVWVAVLLVAFIRRVHGLSWSRSLGAWLALVGAGALTVAIGLVATGIFAVVLATT